MELRHPQPPPFLQGLAASLARAPVEPHPLSSTVRQGAAGTRHVPATLERVLEGARNKGVLSLGVRQRVGGGALILGGVTAWNLTAPVAQSWLAEVREAAGIALTSAPRAGVLERPGARTPLELNPTFDGTKATFVLAAVRPAQAGIDEATASAYLQLLDAVHGNLLAPDEALVLHLSARQSPPGVLLPLLADLVLLALVRGAPGARPALRRLGDRMESAAGAGRLAAIAEPLAECLRFEREARVPEPQRWAVGDTARAALSAAPGELGLRLAGLVSGLQPQEFRSSAGPAPGAASHCVRPPSVREPNHAAAGTHHLNLPVRPVQTPASKPS